jgi:hypothetical protein
VSREEVDTAMVRIGVTPAEVEELVVPLKKDLEARISAIT